MSVLAVEDLQAEFRLRTGTVRAVNGVSFAVDEGETLAIVGESGSGKSATALSIMGLHPTPPCHYTGGRILFDGRDLLTLSERELRRIRGNDIAMVFQDPMTSLNPVATVGAQIAESVRLHQGASRAEARKAAVQALGDVGIANPERRAREYPHQFSGGMRQRAMIAMALACRPRVLLADEPTTALDVTVQAEIVELLRQLQERHGTAIVLITHDLGLVAQVADRVLVMYAGRPVETSSVDPLFAQPLMPYTWALLRSMPQVEGAGGRSVQPIAGQPPNLLELPDGCPFQPRCPFAHDACAEAVPPLAERMPGHRAACVLSAEEVAARTRGGEEVPV